MKRFLGIVLVAALLIPAVQGSAQEGGLPVPLKQCQLATGAPEASLPQTAILHVRANNFMDLLHSLDNLVMTFLPENAMPPPVQEILRGPNPILTLIGMQTLRAPLSKEQLTAILGIAVDQPISLTFYPMEPKHGFVLSLPMVNDQAFVGILMQILRIRNVEELSLQGKSCYQLQATNPDLPRQMVLVRSEDRVLLCGSQRVASMVINNPSGTSMADEPVVVNTLKQYEKNDLLALLNPAMLKKFLPMVKARFSMLPPREIAEIRRKIMTELPEGQRVRLNMRLRLQFGIDGLEQLLDYLECVSTGAYETLFASLVDELEKLNGVALGVDFTGTQQTLAATLFSDAISPEHATAPIPMKSLEAALANIPGDMQMLLVEGKRPQETRECFVTRMLKAIQGKMEAKRLPMEKFGAFVQYVVSKEKPAALASLAPWTLKTVVRSKMATAAEAPKTILEFLGGTMTPGALLTVLPGLAPEALEKHFAENARKHTDNEKRYQNVLTGGEGEQPFISFASRYRSAPPVGKAKALVVENAYTTRGGFFGYSEHEFINRKILYYRSEGDLLYLQKGSSGANWLAETETISGKEPPQAVRDLLALAPKGTNFIAVDRVIDTIIPLLNGASELEAVAHTEIDAFLAKANELLQKSNGDLMKIENELLALDIPLPVLSLNMSADGKLYCVLLGNLRYPRPKVMPVVNDLFSAFTKDVAAVGGGALYCRTAKGKAEISYVQNTAGLGLLVKSVVNRFHESYMSSPDGMQKLRAKVMMKGDGMQNSEEALLFNSLWEMFFMQPMVAPPPMY